MKKEKQDANLAASYNSIYEEEVVDLKEMQFGWPTNRGEALVKWAETGEHLLEIGFGQGQVLYNLRDCFKELYGVEISPLRIKKAQICFRQHDITNVKFIEGNIERGLDFPDGYFDCIVWADVIEHIIDIFAAMSEISRLLCRDGRLLTTTANIAELRRRLKLLFGTFPSTSGSSEGIDVRKGELFDGGHMHYFTFSMLEKLYRKYGIVPKQRYGFGRLGRLHNIYPSLLSSAVCILGKKMYEYE